MFVSFSGCFVTHHSLSSNNDSCPVSDPPSRQNSTATYDGTLYGQYGEWVDDTGAGTYIESDFHHNGHLEVVFLAKVSTTFHDHFRAG